MPKRKSTKQENGNAFKLWWNRRFSHTKPFYENYKTLHSLGADLDYIDFLREFFARGERVVKEILDEQMKEKRWKDLETEKRALSGRDKYIRVAVNRTIEAIEEKGLPNTAEEKKRIQEEVLRYIRWDDILVLSRNAPKQTATLDWVISELGTNRKSILNYLYPDFPGRKGADKWGDFFLVALTDHLKEKTHNHRAHYFEAYRLLLKLRNKNHGSAQGHREKCKQKVFRFKKDYPRWKRDLHLLAKLRSQISSSEGNSE